MEGFSKGLSTRSGTIGIDHLLFGDSTVRADLACIEANLCVAEDIALKEELAWTLFDWIGKAYSKDVDEAHDDHHNARSNDNPPKCQT
jgi:hypothetical protein